MKSLRPILLGALACLFLTPVHAQLNCMSYELLAKYLLTADRVAKCKEYLLRRLQENRLPSHLSTADDGTLVLDKWSSVKESDESAYCYFAYRVLCGDTLETMTPSLKGQFLFIYSYSDRITSIRLCDGEFQYDWPDERPDFIRAITVIAEQTKISVVLHVFLNNTIRPTHHMLSCALVDDLSLPQVFLAAMATLYSGNFIRNTALIPLVQYPYLYIEEVTSIWHRQHAMLEATTLLTLTDLMEQEKKSSATTTTTTTTQALPPSQLVTIATVLNAEDNQMAGHLLAFLRIAVGDDAKLLNILASMMAKLH